jgi:malonyl-CoA O-methyltransferase
MNAPQELDPIAGYALWAANYPAHAHNPFMLAEERAMLALLPQSLDGVRVLDVGCGSGRYLLHARQRGATLLGVDQSGPMLARASALGLPVTQGLVTSLPVSAGWADVVVCALTLGHVADLRAALKELARVLDDCGTLLCSDFHPVADALGWKRTFAAGDQRYEPGGRPAHRGGHRAAPRCRRHRGRPALRSPRPGGARGHYFQNEQGTLNLR